MRGLRPLGQNPRIALFGDRLKTSGDIYPAGENHRVDAGADRALRRAGIVAAIENRLEPRHWHGLTHGVDDRLEPARPGRDTGIRGAGDDDGVARIGRSARRSDGLGQRMDHKDRRAAIIAAAGGRPGGRRDVSPCVRLRRS